METGQLTDNGNESHPASPQGQKDFMIELFNGIRNVEDNYVIGDLYWDPIMIEHDGVGWAMKFGDPERGIPDQADANVVSNTTLSILTVKRYQYWMHTDIIQREVHRVWLKVR